MKLVANWRSSWRWLSMRFIAAAAIWESIPDDAKAAVLSLENQGKVTFALLVLAAVGRLKDQGTGS